MANKVTVTICGERIVLDSTESEEYLQEVAQYLDGKFSELMAHNITASINERVRTMLIAINVADDFFKCNDKLERLGNEHEKYITEIGRMQQENMLLSEKFYEIQGDYARLKASYDELVAKHENKAPVDNANVVSLPTAEQRKAVL